MCRSIPLIIQCELTPDTIDFNTKQMSFDSSRCDILSLYYWSLTKLNILFFQNTNDSMRKLKYFGAVTCAAVSGSYLNFAYQDSRRQPFHVANVPAPEINVGVIKAVFGLLPKGLRDYILVAGAAPNPSHIQHTVRDTWELSRQSPYVVEKVFTGILSSGSGSAV